MAEKFGSSIGITKDFHHKLRVMAAQKDMKIYEIIKEAFELFEQKHKNENISNQVQNN